MIVHRHRAATVLLTVVLALAIVGWSGRHAEASGYYITAGALTTIPASWGAYAGWASYVAGGTTAAGGGAALGSVVATGGLVLAAAAIGYVGWKIWDGWGAGDVEYDDPDATVTPLSPWGSWTNDGDPATEDVLEASSANVTVLAHPHEVIEYADGAKRWRIEVELWEHWWDPSFTGSFGGCSADGATHGTGMVDIETNHPGGWAKRTDVDPPGIFWWEGTCPAGAPEVGRADVRTYAYNRGDTRRVWSRDGDSPPGDQAVIVASAECVELVLDAVNGWETQVVASVEAESLPYYIGGEVPAVPALECPDGSRIRNLTVDRRAYGGSSIPDRNLMDYSTPAQLEDPNDQPYGEQCFANGPCQLMLYRLEPGTDRSWDCNENNDYLCAGWAEDPDRETLYECRYGHYPDAMDHVVPLSDCFFLERAFEPDSAGQLTESGPGSETGDTAAPAPSSNPFKAALDWAFVPKTATARWGDLRQTAATKAPFTYITEVGEWFGAHGDVGEVCWNVAIDVNGLSSGNHGDHSVIDSCGQGPVWSWLASKRSLLSVFVWALFITPFAWWAWKQYAPGSQGVA